MKRRFFVVGGVIVASAAVVFLSWVFIGHVFPVDSTTQSSDPTPLSGERSVGWKTYTNTAFGYQINYLATWVVEPERAFLDAPNTIPSEVYIHTPDESMSLRIRVNKNEWMLRHEAPKTQTITSAGKEQTAYLFPEGYECNLGETDSTYDCSFFVVVIPHGEVWYELWARGDAKTITGVWNTIISSFQFIDTGTQQEAHTQSATTSVTFFDDGLFLFENQLPYRWDYGPPPNTITLEPKEVLFIGVLLDRNDPSLPTGVVEAGSRTSMDRIGFYKLESVSRDSSVKTNRVWFEPRVGFDYYVLCNYANLEPDTKMIKDAVQKRWPEGKVSVKPTIPYGKRVAVTNCNTFVVLGVSPSGEITREFQFYPD